MAHLSISLLGAFRVELDGEPASGFDTNKARALLAYLAVEADRPHARIHLAGLLWPDWPEVRARTYLRQALANLRAILGDDGAAFLIADRDCIQFNPASDHRLDTAQLQRALARVSAADGQPMAADTAAPLQDAVGLYQGDFLEEFFLDGCSAFEEWQLLTRERLRRQVVQALGLLIDWCQAHGDLGAARRYAWQRVEIEPLLEEGNRQLMHLLALAGEGNVALAHFEGYRRLLEEELSAEPSATTAALAEQIRLGQIASAPAQSLAAAVVPSGGPGQSASTWPPFLPSRPVVQNPPVPFVDREDALRRLETHLQRALAGSGHVVFVAGDAGEGKTALLREFCRRVEDDHAGLLVAGGQCSSHRGAGDPLLPFREILARLSGDVEDGWGAGEISDSQVRRLWQACPHAVDGLLLHGPDLIGSLAPASALAARVALLPGAHPWRARLDGLLRQRELAGGSASPFEQALFGQFTKVMRFVAAEHPLLLWLDDLQWADLDSIALLFHLGQRLAGSRILVIGTYRPEEVAAEREGRRHPLARVLHELLRMPGPHLVDLAECDGRRFLDALLDWETNHLGESFRQTLFALSEGHPLFTVELLQGMQDRGELIRDAAGAWIQGSALDWDVLPPRVETAIAERLQRLPVDLRRILAVASVQGEHFAAEVVARVLEQEPRRIIEQLSGELERWHRLVVAQGVQRIGQQRLARYRFTHILFQKYLYDSLADAERAYVHEAIATSLEALYSAAGDLEGINAQAAQLAYHFGQAGAVGQALRYRLQAARNALRFAAHQEAVAHFDAGLALLAALPASAARLQRELELQMGKATALSLIRGHANSESGTAYGRALTLARQIESEADILAALWGLWRYHHVCGRVQASKDLAEQFLADAEQSQDPLHLMEARHAMGLTLYAQGEFTQAQEELQLGLQLAETELDPQFAVMHGQDPIMANQMFLGLVLWFRGWPVQAERASQAALDRARQVDHVFSQTMAHIGLASMVTLRRSTAETLHHATMALDLAQEHGFVQWSAWASMMRNWAICLQNPNIELVAAMRKGLDSWEHTGARVWTTRMRAVLAEGYAAIGRRPEALALVDEALHIAHETGERMYVAELHRLRGELLLSLGKDAEEAESCFRHAVDVAQRQQAKSLELRAATSLCRLGQAPGQIAEARRRLADIYGWFTEGFDTPDLLAAKALLSQTAHRG